MGMDVPAKALLVEVDGIPVAIYKDAAGKSLATAFDIPATRTYPLKFALDHGVLVSDAMFHRLMLNPLP
jgi:hypothetical protein